MLQIIQVPHEALENTWSGNKSKYVQLFNMVFTSSMFSSCLFIIFLPASLMAHWPRVAEWKIHSILTTTWPEAHLPGHPTEHRLISVAHGLERKGFWGFLVSLVPMHLTFQHGGPTAAPSRILGQSGKLDLCGCQRINEIHTDFEWL